MQPLPPYWHLEAVPGTSDRTASEQVVETLVETLPKMPSNSKDTGYLNASSRAHRHAGRSSKTPESRAHVPDTACSAVRSRLRQPLAHPRAKAAHPRDLRHHRACLRPRRQAVLHEIGGSRSFARHSVQVAEPGAAAQIHGGDEGGRAFARPAAFAAANSQVARHTPA